jgi:hypothetical protein
MRLKDFAYWSRWHLDRAGFPDFDVFLYRSPKPQGFFCGRAIAVSLEHVLINSWSAVDQTIEHEIIHAILARDGKRDAEDFHGPNFIKLAYSRCMYRREGPTAFSPEFEKFYDDHMSDQRRCEAAERITQQIAFIMDIEGREKRSPDYKGRLRMEFL